MKNLERFLAEREVYPASYEIDEASNYAQEKVNEFLSQHGGYCQIQEGEVYVKGIDFQGDEESKENLDLDAQSIFDEQFASKLDEIQK